MKDDKYNFDDYKKDSLTRPRDLAWSNWAKFEEKGDKVAGYIRDAFYKPADGQYKEQRGITLEQKNGEMINVAIKRIPFILAKTDDMRIGDPLVIELTELKKSQTKGFSPTKVLSFYGKNLPENAGNKTVKQLEEEDMIRGGSVRPSVDEVEVEGEEELDNM